jgi:hypothetical protein
MLGDVTCSGLLSWANDWHVARCEFGVECPLAALEDADRDAYVAGHAPLPSRLSEWALSPLEQSDQH